MKHGITFLPILLSSLLLLSCTGGSNEPTDVVTEDTTATEVVQPDMAEFEFFKIFVNMPTPLEELGNMHKDGIAYNASLLSPVENAEKHTSEDAIAINCGMYLVDMTYQAVYHNTELLLDYSNTVHQLAEKFNAVDIFDNLIANKLEGKLEDKESLQVIIEKGLESMEEKLADSKRLNTATQLMVGSWVEMQYILTQSILELPADKIATDLKEHIFSQREHLDNLLILLKEVKDEAGLHDELAKLEQLEASFTKIHEAEEVSHDILVEVAAEIKEIRTDLLAM